MKSTDKSQSHPYVKRTTGADIPAKLWPPASANSPEPAPIPERVPPCCQACPGGCAGAAAPKNDAVPPPPPAGLPAPDGPAFRCRTGKIARLPLAVREQLNERLLEGGEGGKSLVAWLNSLPEVQSIMKSHFEGAVIREQNLSEWRQGGYQEWRKQKERRGAVAEFQENMTGMKGVAQESLTEQLAFYLASHVIMELKRLESVPDGEEKARVWRQLTATVVALRRGDLERDRILLQREKYDLKHKTKEEREAEFWKWADVNINRDEFCRRRCFTAEQREAAIDEILGITPEWSAAVKEHRKRHPEQYAEEWAKLQAELAEVKSQLASERAPAVSQFQEEPGPGPEVPQYEIKPEMSQSQTGLDPAAGGLPSDLDPALNRPDPV